MYSDSTIIFYPLLSIALWVIAGIMHNKNGGKAGLKFFFKQFLISMLVYVALFFIIVYPQRNCPGMFCSVAVFIIYLMLIILIGVVWAIILLAISKSRYAKVDKRASKEVIDDIL